jgi:hypothetical protein
MSMALAATLRESCGYLRDDGYHQTARLMAAAADEIERLNGRVHALEAREPPVFRRRDAASGTLSADRADIGARRHHGR